MNNLELKKQNIEKWVKIMGLGIAGFLFAPFAYLTITGIVSLIVVGLIGVLVFNIGVPWLATSIANWRLKALKAVAAANPIETLENQYRQRELALIKIRDNLKEFHVVVEDMKAQINEHNEKYPDRPSQFAEKYQKMVQLLNLRADKYKKAQANLAKFSQVIEEKRSDWQVAQAAAKAMKLANVGEDFQSKLMQDTALNTVQDGLNFAFSELEVSLLDSQPIVVEVKQVSEPKPKAQLAPVAESPLDLTFDEREMVYKTK